MYNSYNTVLVALIHTGRFSTEKLALVQVENEDYRTVYQAAELVGIDLSYVSCECCGPDASISEVFAACTPVLKEVVRNLLAEAEADGFEFVYNEQGIVGVLVKEICHERMIQNRLCVEEEAEYKRFNRLLQNWGGMEAFD